MPRSSESLLEDIFDELRKTNKALGESNNNKSRNSSSSSSSGSSSGDDKGLISKTISKIGSQLGDLPGALGGVTKSFLDLSDFSKQPLDRLQGVLDSSVRVFNDIPILGGIIGSTLGGIGDLFMAVLNKLNGDLLSYNKFNTEGFYNNDGMEGFQRDLAKTQMPLNDFMSAVVKNKETMASMGAESTSMMGNYIESLKKYESSTGALNQSLPQLGDYILSNIKALKVQGVFDKAHSQDYNTSMQEYTRNLNDFSKVLGISTDDLNKKLNGSEGIAKQLDLTLSLMTTGMSRDKAEAASNNVSLALASMSDLGSDMQGSIDEILSKGTIGNTSDFDKLLNSGSSGTLRQQLEKVASDMRLGLASGKEYSKALADSMFNNKDAIIKELESVQMVMKNARPEVAAKANRYIQILRQMTEVPDLKGNTSPFDNFITGVNNSINEVGSIIKGYIGNIIVESGDYFNGIFKTIHEMAFNGKSLSDGWKDIKPNLGGLLKNLFGEKMGSWLMGGNYTIEGAVTAAGFNYKNLADTVEKTFNHVIDLATPYLDKAMQNTIDYLGKVLEKVIDKVLPDFMKSGPHAGSAEKQQAQQAQAQTHVGGNYGATGGSNASAAEAARQLLLEEAKKHEVPKPAENLPSPATPAPTPVQTASTDKQKEDDQQAPIIPNINAPLSTDNTASTHTNYNQVQTNTQQLLLLQKQVELLQVLADKLASHYQYVRVN